MFKTKAPIQIHLNRYAQAVLQKYIDTDTTMPVVTVQYFNREVKKLRKMAGINSPVHIVRYRGKQRIMVSSKFARRTFITLSLEPGMRPDVLMKFTGHKSFKTMKRYIDLRDKVKQ